MKKLKELIDEAVDECAARTDACEGSDEGDFAAEELVLLEELQVAIYELDRAHKADKAAAFSKFTPTERLIARDELLAALDKVLA